MTLLNWILGLLSLVIWGGSFAYYFRGMVRDAWRARNDKWFRNE